MFTGSRNLGAQAMCQTETMLGHSCLGSGLSAQVTRSRAVGYYNGLAQNSGPISSNGELRRREQKSGRLAPGDNLDA
jgi:hypothetical protein